MALIFSIFLWPAGAPLAVTLARLGFTGFRAARGGSGTGRKRTGREKGCGLREECIGGCPPKGSWGQTHIWGLSKRCHFEKLCHDILSDLTREREQRMRERERENRE